MESDEAEICGVCSVARGEHGEMNHEFNIHGTLILKKVDPPKVIQRPLALDVVLRLLLIEKGVITGDDLTGMEANIREQLQQAGGPPSDPPDTGTGAGDNPDRS